MDMLNGYSLDAISFDTNLVNKLLASSSVYPKSLNENSFSSIVAEYPIKYPSLKSLSFSQ